MSHKPISEAPRSSIEDSFSYISHDLDKPFVASSADNILPRVVTSTLWSPMPAGDLAGYLPPEPPLSKEQAKTKGQESIRVVAEGYRRQTPDSRVATSANPMPRKRNTKRWGDKVEEIPFLQARLTPIVPELPPSGITFKWVRGELIGRGAYGRLYLALNVMTGEMIAAKQVDPLTHRDEDRPWRTAVYDALKMKDQMWKNLSHPNIVPYLGFEETPQNLTIFTEYVPGASIGHCLAKHDRFDEQVTKSFTSQILSGLEYIHSKGIFHWNLKSNNVLVQTSGCCQLSDFGIFERANPEAAEVYGLQRDTDIDIWSVGCIVLEMWAGKRLWEEEDMVAGVLGSPPLTPSNVLLSSLAHAFRQSCFALAPYGRVTASELIQHPYLYLPPDWAFHGFT